MMYKYKAKLPFVYMIRSQPNALTDVEQRAQPKLTMQTEGDFPLCFTALDRGLCSGAERALVAIKQHPTRRGARSQHS